MAWTELFVRGPSASVVASLDLLAIRAGASTLLMRNILATPLLAVLSTAAVAQSLHPTPLVEDDLSTGKRKQIDSPSDDFDASLDAALGGASGFSTKELLGIADRIRQELKRDRPRATPRVVMFLYPGKITIEKLRTMREIYADLELIMDPCERSVCKDAVAKHIEMVGRTVANGVAKGNGYQITLRTLTLRTATLMQSAEVEVYSVPILDCIVASKKAGGGSAWLASRQQQNTDYVPIVTKAIQREATSRRVALLTVPSVARSTAEVEVRMKARGDRNRFEQQAIDAFSAAAAGVRSNPASPSLDKVRLELAQPSDSPGGKTRLLRTTGAPAGLFLDGKLNGSSFYKSYVEEVKRGKDAGQRMDFSDDEAQGSSGTQEAAPPDDNEAIAVLAQNFSALGKCAREEIGRNPKFTGVTLTFRWMASGVAEGIGVKEPLLRGGPLVQCLVSALSSISLPHFSGAARTIEYPIRLK